MVPPRPTTRSPSGRFCVERLIYLAIAWLVVEMWLLQGVIKPCYVVSGSMAEDLLGLHREVVCADCGFSFACGLETDDGCPAAVCPNCSYRENPLADAPKVSGDGVLIARSAFCFRPPRRWEVIAFRGNADADEILVKRVVGLPGEAVEIREGDVFIDGRMVRKTLREQRALAVLVHDSAFTPQASALPPRWCGEDKQSGWNIAQGRFSHPAEDGKAATDWLEYRHATRSPGQPGKVQETPISDDLAYNQNLSRRAEECRAVTDVMLAFRLLETSGEGQLVLHATDGRDAFEAELDPLARRWSAFRNGQPIPGAAGALPPMSGKQIVFSLFDRQVLLAVEDQTLLAWPYEPPEDAPKPTARPLKIGSRGLGVALDDLRVYRDVYYTRPTGLDARWGLDRPWRLSADEFFVLGDNSADSVDSRSWPDGPAVGSKLLFGKPLAVTFPAKHVQWWGCRFQVPDPCRIRYIR